MLNRLITEAAEASPVIERINASADDLALACVVLSYVNVASTLRFSQRSNPNYVGYS